MSDANTPVTTLDFLPTETTFNDRVGSNLNSNSTNTHTNASAKISNAKIDGSDIESGFISPSASDDHKRRAFVSADSRWRRMLYGGRFEWLLDLEEEEEAWMDPQRPLHEELEIDPTEIMYKMRCVIFPYKLDRAVLVSNPDFWGPLFCIIFYAMLLVWGQLDVVSWTITIWFLGSFLIFVLARSLGGEVSFSQSLSVIGYSILPLSAAVMACVLGNLDGYPAFWTKFACTIWSAFSASSLLVTTEIEPKKLLLSYPMFLLYVYFISMSTGV
eukprot:TRINITY_DN5601_c0_g1_i1.p1 TRINITY_DN5601_c0_g1~~TRINITY_DN5601_c0_g1_i1.p1  ORF type:complete len:272 (+),score=55.93 TRINITY_DN5601_c0_g1_i1:45-860(+)